MSEIDVNEVDAAKAVAEKKPVKKVTKSASPKPSNDAIEAISDKGSVLFMNSTTGSWTTPSGVTFNRARPYQYVPTEEIEALLASGRFRRAEPTEVQEFYNIEL